MAAYFHPTVPAKRALEPVRIDSTGTGCCATLDSGCWHEGCILPHCKTIEWSIQWFHIYIYVLVCLPRETETAKKAGTSEKDGVLSKNPGFLNFLIFHGALSHKVLPLMLENQQCSYQDAASVLWCLVPCRARDFVGKLFLHFSTTFLRRKCSDKQCQVLHTRSIRNNLNWAVAKTPM